MLVLASITVLTLDYHGEASRAITHVRNGVVDVLAPIQRAIAATLHPVGDVVSGAFHYGQLQSQNAQLRVEQGALERQLYADRYASAVALEERDLEGQSYVANMASVPAEVIENSTSNFEYTVEIDRGTSSGVGDGMPVVGLKGLVGRVENAAKSTATVQLLTDKASSIGVVDSANNLYELAGEGEGNPLALQSFGSSPGPLRVGSMLLTSGQRNGQPASAYPPGIPVGVVHSAHVASGGLSTTASVTPIVDLDNLQYVVVLQWPPPA